MVTRLAPKLALATVAAVGLYVPTVGLPVLRSCSQAGAAPSPTCGNDLRECLRLSARTGIYGARYVTADDVAKCVETFNACIHGGASGSGNHVPPTSTSAGGNTRNSVPQHFGIDSEHFTYDCSVDGDAVTCSSTWKTAPTDVDSFTQEITGNLSGLNMTGTATSNLKYHNSTGCKLESSDSHTVNFAFSLDGTVAMHSEPYTNTLNYTCPEGSGSNVIDAPALDFTANWSEK